MVSGEQTNFYFVTFHKVVGACVRELLGMVGHCATLFISGKISKRTGDTCIIPEFNLPYVTLALGHFRSAEEGSDIDIILIGLAVPVTTLLTRQTLARTERGNYRCH